MNHLFQVTVYTGQQLVLEALQRWLRKPCIEETNQRQRRTSIKGLFILLLKTAATGVLATILDAAIEYRRRQLLLVAQEEPSTSSTDVSRFPGLGALSRAGIAAWKTRLLHAIDEMERHAEQYGIEPTHRFAPSNAATSAADTNKGKAILLDCQEHEQGSKSFEEDADERRVELSKTVEQLRELVKQGSEEAERQLDERVDQLLDTLLGPAEPAVLPSTTPKRGSHLTTALTSNSTRTMASSRSASLTMLSSTLCRSSNNNTSTTAAPAVSLIDCNNPGALNPTSPSSSSSSSAPSSECTDNDSQVCHICMDREVRVKVVGCSHDLCFQCARRLCATQDHTMPQCPFCRQTINGFEAMVSVVP